MTTGSSKRNPRHRTPIFLKKKNRGWNSSQWNPWSHPKHNSNPENPTPKIIPRNPLNLPNLGSSLRRTPPPPPKRNPHQHRERERAWRRAERQGNEGGREQSGRRRGARTGSWSAPPTPASASIDRSAAAASRERGARFRREVEITRRQEWNGTGYGWITDGVVLLSLSLLITIMPFYPSQFVIRPSF